MNFICDSGSDCMWRRGMDLNHTEQDFGKSEVAGY